MSATVISPDTFTLELHDGFISVTGVKIPEELCNKLKYWRREIKVHGYKREIKGAYDHLYTLSPQLLQSGAMGERLYTMFGLTHRVKCVLRELGIQFSLHDYRTPHVSVNMKNAVEGLRPYQLEPVYNALMSGGGIITAPTGYGKTHIVGGMIRAFDREDLKTRGTPQIVFAAPEIDITAKNHTALSEMFPDRDVGIVMSGKSKFSDDIQVITIDSLHRLDPDDVGVLIIDEVHTAASDSRAEKILNFKKAAKWGVSATPTGRFDGKDLVTEGLFGPPVFTATYADGVKCGALVPITVYWVKAPLPEQGMQYYNARTSRDGKYRSGVWRNASNSKLISDIISRLPDDMQTLCIMQFIAQMENIAGFTKDDVTYVHGETNATKLSGIVPAVSKKQRTELYAQMANGEIRKMMSTYVYKQGVDFPHLEVVINAGGGGSEIVATQIPGRESRKTEDKERSYLIDFQHDWDMSEDAGGRKTAGPILKDDRARRRAYEGLGFEQICVDNWEDIPFLKKTSDGTKDQETRNVLSTSKSTD